MPLRLRRSLDNNNTTERGSDDDERVETCTSTATATTITETALRPLTTEARPGDRRASLGFYSPQPGSNTAMPPIFPAPLVFNENTGSSNTTAKLRRTFLPQLSNAKSLAQSQDTEVPQDDEDTVPFKQAMWAGQANILVTVRVRPHCSHDRDEREIVKVLDNKLIVVLDKHQPPPASSPQHRASLTAVEPLPMPQPRRGQQLQSSGGQGLRKLRNIASAHPSRIPTTNQTSSNTSTSNIRSREKRYAFDYVFTPQDGQQTVYYHTTKFLIHGVLNGFNATVFAYGCTGAGKTYTMLGTPDEPGIMALTLDDLFQNIERVHSDPQATVVYKVTVSFLEVYNENIRDLLVTPLQSPMTSAGISEYLDLREDPIKGPVVAGISEVEASNAQDVMKLLRRGNKHRSQEATAANAVSSRSHAVLQVLVEQREKTSSSDSFGVDASRGGTMTSTVKYGKLSLVDLAGSERAAVTQNRGQRLIEGANINRSLLALGNCINALGEKASSVAGVPFVPYRDSKLTRLLKDSLGGNCRTVMIANVSPAAASVEETLNTLKYANRAKNIKTTVTRNVLSVDHHLTEYAGVVAELKDEIVMLKKQLARQTQGERVIRPQLAPERDEDEEWKQTKLKEARGYICQCFQQRQQLKCGLLETDHWIDELTRRRRASAGSNNPEEQPQRDLATAILQDIVGSSQEKETPTADRLDHQIQQLVTKKMGMVTQLERNHSVMDEFRRGIEQSPLFRSNELLRDVLLMEYRVGDLQVENAFLQAKERIQHSDSTKVTFSLDTPGSDGSNGPTDGVPPLDLAELAQFLSPKQQQHSETGEPSGSHTTRSTTGFAFLNDLRDRFYHVNNKTTESQSPKRTGSSSPRRQWGIHLNNATLPYIRLKKKAPPLGVETGSSYPHDPAAPEATNLRTSATAAAPYLKVLKHRRKLHHRNSTTNSNSHKKLPLVISTSS